MKSLLPVGCCVLAAGGARRFGSNKLETVLEGRSLIRRALEVIPRECFFRVAVVSRYPEILRLAEDFSFTALQNPDPDRGISSSLQLGLRALEDCGGVLFLVADQPLLRRESLCRLTDAWQARPQKIAALSHGGVRGNPCLFPARFFPELLALTGDRGGSAVIRRHPEDLITVECAPEELWDVDTPEALAHLPRKRP